MNTRFLDIDDILITQGVLETKFTCDLSKCKGACCTMESDYGALISEAEIKKIERDYDIIKEYLPQENIEEIEKIGFWEEKEEQLMTTSINKRECVFAYYDGDVAKCAIEKAYFDGKVKFRKPISCHLFPIRITDFGGPVLRYEEYDQCSDALKLGEETGLKVIDFCKDSLIRFFGEEWYDKVEKELGK